MSDLCQHPLLEDGERDLDATHATYMWEPHHRKHHCSRWTRGAVNKTFTAESALLSVYIR